MKDDIPPLSWFGLFLQWLNRCPNCFERINPPPAYACDECGWCTRPWLMPPEPADTREPAVLENNGEIVLAHPPTQCAGSQCCLHNRSDHHMRSWPQVWRGDRGLMERICPHGCGHPDLDDFSEDHVHGCDGCCIPPETVH